MLEERGEIDEARKLLRVAAEETGRWNAWADLGAFLHGSGDQHEAVEALQRAIELGATSPFNYRQLAHALQEDGAGLEAVKAVAVQLSEALPESPSAWMTVGVIYSSLGLDADAEAAFRAAISEGGSGIAELMLARHIKDVPDRGAEAEALFRRAISEAPGRMACGPSKELALFLVHNGRDDEAEVVLKSAIERNAECYCCLVRQGEICFRKGRRAEALERFDAAIAIDPAAPPALLGKSRVVDNEAEASDLVAKALDTAPNDPECLLRRAQVGPINEGRLEDARRAVELGPRLIEAHLFLAPIDAKAGRSDEALDCLRCALEHLRAGKEWIPTFVSSAMAVAQSGYGEQVRGLIEQSDAAPLMEPVIVALQILRGESPLVAKEIFDVASDIVDKARQTSAPASA